MENKKINFIPGLGEQPSDYKALSSYLNIIKINWNNIKINVGRVDTLAGFSMGAVLACDYALKQKVKTLILCSMTPGAETLKDVRADKIIFIVGEKEKWVIKDIKRSAKTLPHKNFQIIVVPKADHKITGIYRKKLLEVVNKLK